MDAKSDFGLLSKKITVRFYLEGIHCLGCLWLLEKLPELDPWISSAKLDVALQILEVQAKDSSIPWAKVTGLLSQLGYTAKVLADTKGDELRRSDHRWQLARIGVAAFSAGNIMLLSVAIYAGADSFWGLRFGWLSLLLALPALTFSAWPLYRSALAPLRFGRLSVDLAISLAIVAGAAMSLWSLAKGLETEIYFDSLTMLVFLLLSSRFFLSRFRESLAKESACLSFLSSVSYRKRSPTMADVSAASIFPGDEIELLTGQPLPTDSLLIVPEAYFDLSLLTGESTPVKFLAGDRIDAGAKLCSDDAAVRALLPAGKSRLARIMDQIKTYELSHSPAIELADRIGRYFVVVVLLLALALLSFLPGEEGLKRALALIIVTCPCVLAFAIPLAFTRTMQVAASRGILFLAPEKIEKLARVKNFFFDKTGTLTTGQFEVLSWIHLCGDDQENRTAVFSLEILSAHPIGKSIVRFLSLPLPIVAATESREIPGFGIEGKFQGRHWRVGRAPAANRPGKTTLGVWREGEQVALIQLGDALRADSATLIQSIQQMGISTHLLSGDSEVNTAAIAAETGVESWRSSLLPEDKAKIVSEAQDSVMIGDGANDAMAFHAAGLGIAVQGAVEISLKNADIVLTQPGIKSALDALFMARSTLKIVRTNFIVTLTYNILAGSLAVAGWMQPMWAAILMPISALSVFALTQWRTRGGHL
jgi:Cu2+-exporting ATPase/Cu+-exporting ATPase